MKNPQMAEDRCVDLPSKHHWADKSRQEDTLSLYCQPVLSLPVGCCKCGRTAGREKWGEEKRQRYESVLIPSQGAAVRAVAWASVKQGNSKLSHTESIWCPPSHGLLTMSWKKETWLQAWCTLEMLIKASRHHCWVMTPGNMQEGHSSVHTV